SGNVTGSASVNYFTANGSASSGSDYVALPTTPLSFATDERTKTVSVTVNGDTAIEPNETFVLRLTSPVGATVSDDTGVATITNDDAQGYLSINDLSIAEGDSGSRTATFTITR